MVVQDNQKFSRTTKDEFLEHFGCPYGQPRWLSVRTTTFILRNNFATEHADIYAVL